MRIVDGDLSLTFAAPADPTRRAILARLALGEATVNRLAEPFAMTQQAISKKFWLVGRTVDMHAADPHHDVAEETCRCAARP